MHKFFGGVGIVRKLYKNREIRADKVRLVDPESKSQEVIPLDVAIKKAEELELDLVAISINTSPPVCKILDYSQFLYEQNKKEKKAKKQSKANILKELKLSPKISENDFMVRFRAAQKFLGKGYKVKFSVFFRGREITHPDLGRALLERLKVDLAELAIVDFGPSFNGPFAIMIMSPKK